MKTFTEWLKEHEYLYDDLDKVDREDPTFWLDSFIENFTLCAAILCGE